MIVGTGLYYLRNINSTGAEGAGWPKFTGGWLFGVPAVGDVDGDGNLEVAALTREGNSFLWDTDRPACGGNDEWWTSRHDEWSTGAYGMDSRPPGTPTQLAVTPQRPSATLTFTAPGRRLAVRPGAAATGSSSPPERSITPRTAPSWATSTRRAPPAQTETRTVAEHRLGATRVAVLYQDDAGNWGRLASAAVPAPNVGFLFGRGNPGSVVQRHERATSSAPRASSCGSRPPFGP